MASFPLAIKLPKFQPQLALKALAIASGVVGLAIASALIWLLQFSPLSALHHNSTSPEILRLAPRQSLAAIALDVPLVDVDRLQRYLAPLTARRTIHRQWQRWLSANGNGPLSEFLTATQLDFGQDIRPWLGDESLLAIASITDNRPDYFIALSTADVDRSNLLLNVLWRGQYLQQQDPQVVAYKGVQLLTIPVNNRDWVVGALGNRYTLFATSSDIAQEAIDSWQVEELSLASNPNYHSGIKASDSQLGIAYIDNSDSSALPKLWGLSPDEWNLNRDKQPVWAGLTISEGQLNPVPQT